MNRKLQSLSDAESVLLQYSPAKMHGGSYALERMVVLMEKLGNPQNSLQVIHVAGTSGKTSTAYFIRNLLEQTGKRTGLTASPHIEKITERVQVDGQPLQDDVFLAYLNEFLGLLEQWPDIAPTYFELLVAFAYWIFAKERVDYAVIEVGLGGLLDATNVVHRTDKVCVITPISLDHTEVLGNTITAIAIQKTGIITTGNGVFSANQPIEAREVIRQVSEANSAELTEVSVNSSQRVTHLPLFQQQNWQLALAAAEYVE